MVAVQSAVMVDSDAVLASLARIAIPVTLMMRGNLLIALEKGAQVVVRPLELQADRPLGVQLARGDRLRSEAENRQVRLRRHRLHAAQQIRHVAFFRQDHTQSIELRLFVGDAVGGTREAACASPDRDRSRLAAFPVRYAGSARLSSGGLGIAVPERADTCRPPGRRTRRSVHTMAVGQG